MNGTYDGLPPTFSQELSALLDEASTLGIDPKVLEPRFRPNGTESARYKNRRTPYDNWAPPIQKVS